MALWVGSDRRDRRRRRRGRRWRWRLSRASPGRHHGRRRRRRSQSRQVILRNQNTTPSMERREEGDGRGGVELGARSCRSRLSNGGLSSDAFPVWNTQRMNETTKVCIRQEQGHPLNTYSTVALPPSYHTVVCSDGVERHLASPSLPCCSQWPRGAFGRILVMAVSDREIRAHSRRPQETAAEKLESVLSV